MCVCNASASRRALPGEAERYASVRGRAALIVRLRSLFAGFIETRCLKPGLCPRTLLLPQSLQNPHRSRERRGKTRLQERRIDFRFEPYQGASTVLALVNQRVGQDFFRRAVLANYEETCCITGIADPRLLTASHIKPWGSDSKNRHNPANGLLLSATLDRAFDRGLITIDPNRRVVVSRQLRESRSRETREYFRPFEQASLRPAIRFDPDPAFLDWHSANCFVDQRRA